MELDFVFILHSLWRWIVLLMGIAAVLKAAIGWLGKQPWQDIDQRLSLGFIVTFHIQFVLGVTLYILSLMGIHKPYWYTLSIARLTMEHVVIMSVAWILATVIYSLVKRRQNFKMMTIGYGIALVMILVAIPPSAWFLRF